MSWSGGRTAFDSLPRARASRPLPFGILASQPRIGISDVGQGQTTLGFMIEAPLDRGKWRKEVKKEGRGVASRASWGTNS